VDFIGATAPLARLAARADRLLPVRAARAAGVRLSASAGVVRLAAVEEETGVWGELPAIVHGDGVVSVGRRALAATLAALDAPEVRVRVEGSRLAVRTEAARFALPLLDEVVQPELPQPPPIAGAVDTTAFTAAVIAVAGAASRDGLALFTGVRVRSAGDRLSLVATDRFRLAAATLPWAPGSGEVDVLVPAATLAEAVRQAAGPQVSVCAGGGRLALQWSAGDQTAGLVTASLALPFPDAQLERLLATKPECIVDVEADALRAAVERAIPFAGTSGAVSLEAADGMVVVRGGDTAGGDSREEIKAHVQGDHLTASYQGRYLLDALRAFPGRRVTVQLQAGIQPTAFAAAASATADSADLRYLVVPLRHRD
jgi:DNA polymerase-3 subunit beta